MAPSGGGVAACAHPGSRPFIPRPWLAAAPTASTRFKAAAIGRMHGGFAVSAAAGRSRPRASGRLGRRHAGPRPRDGWLPRQRHGMAGMTAGASAVEAGVGPFDALAERAHPGSPHLCRGGPPQGVYPLSSILFSLFLGDPNAPHPRSCDVEAQHPGRALPLPPLALSSSPRSVARRSKLQRGMRRWGGDTTSPPRRRPAPLSFFFACPFQRPGLWRWGGGRPSGPCLPAGCTPPIPVGPPHPARTPATVAA